MPFWLAHKRDGQQSDFIQRFDPRFWTVDFPRPMMASVVTTGADSLRVDLEFHHADALAGLIWHSSDRYDHPLLLFDRQATVEVKLVSADFELTSATAQPLAAGANRALIGTEVIQFADAVSLGGSVWRLRGLLRGRGGTEEEAQAGHATGAPFVLLDGQPLALDPAKLEPTNATSFAAIGLVDAEPVVAPIANPGLTLRPLTPVHPRLEPTSGGLILRWTRRARGAWAWPNGTETPLNEQAERYLVGLGDTEQPALRWEPTQRELELSAATLADLASEHPGQPLWVRQVGSHAVSAPLLLTTLG